MGNVCVVVVVVFGVLAWSKEVSNVQHAHSNKKKQKRAREEPRYLWERHQFLVLLGAPLPGAPLPPAPRKQFLCCCLSHAAGKLTQEKGRLGKRLLTGNG